MSYITLKCKNCGASMSIDFDAKTVTCIHCGSTFLLSELFDEEDVNVIKQFKPSDIEKKANFTEAIKKGEVCLYQGEFVKAEEYFKRAIEIDEENYKGYFGVIRAKTHNFNILPDTDDYAQYAKITLNLVDRDNEDHIKSELQKLDLLKREKLELKKIETEREAEQKKKERKKQNTENFLTKIICVLIIVIAGIVLLTIYLTDRFYKEPSSNAERTYEINTITDFRNFLSDEDLLSATIVLNTNIDFSGITLSPIGTKDKPFTGKFYGNGKILKNFEITNPVALTETYSGLFGYINNAEISGIILEDVTFSLNLTSSTYTHSNFGFIVGYAENSTIRRCAVDDSCSANLSKIDDGSFSVGGIVGQVNNSLISFSYSNANIQTNYTNVSYVNGYNSLRYNLGGIVGEANQAKISSCYSAGTLSSSITSDSTYQVRAYVAGIAGYVTYTNASDFYLNSCYFVGTIDNNVSASNLDQSTAGIVAHGATSNEMLSNYVYFVEDKFIQNNLSLPENQLTDQTFNINSVRVVDDTSTLLNFISSIFSDENWENVNSLTPSLKF